MATTNGVNGANGVNGHTATAHVSAEDFLKTEFDYVICGGGTAGLVVAARLSENPDVKVGVIEAGGNKLGDPFVDIPGMFLQMFNKPEYDYSYMTTPQPTNGKVHHMVRGKMLGGSSGINYMMYVRGHLQDFDYWAELAEDETWSSKNIMEYMRKHETLEPIDEAVVDRSYMLFAGENHGTSGPVRTSFNDNALPIEGDIIKAAAEATGLLKKPIDPWSGDHIGFFNTLGSVVRTGPNKGKRSYTARGYYQANQYRPNLKVVCDSTVAKVILEHGAATGVEFISDGQKRTVKAKREVIVAGGAVASPQILELSGIGNPEILKAAGVECLVDLPSVGEDLQDHPMIVGASRFTPDIMTMESIYRPEIMEMAQKALMENGAGPLTNVACVQGFYPIKWFLEDGELEEIIKSIEDTEGGTEFHRKQRKQIIEQLKSDTAATMQFVFVPAAPNHDGIKDQSLLFPPPADPNAAGGGAFACCWQYPVARGHVHITSNDPFAHPEIDPNYGGHPADIAVLAASLRFVEKMREAKALEGKIGERLWPKPNVDLSDREQRREAAKEMVMSEYHPCGSVAMGSSLDSRLRVKGVKNLRVVDAASFANNVSGNIQSSVYATAEKAADMIKEDNGYAALNGSQKIAA